MRLFDADTWTEILETISRNRKRSVMTALGVVWGTFMLVLLLGFGNGMSEIMTSSSVGMANKSVLFNSWRTSMPYRGMQAGRLIEFDLRDCEYLEGVDGIEDVACWSEGNYGDADVDGEKISSVVVMGVNQAVLGISGHIPVAGRLLNFMDEEYARKVCMVSVEFAEDISPSDPSAVVGKTLYFNGMVFTVVGSFESNSSMVYMGDPSRTVQIPFSTASKVFGGGNDKVSVIVAKVDEGHEVADVEKRALAVLKEMHGVHPDDPEGVMSFSMDYIYNQVEGFLKGFRFLVWVVGLGSLIAGVVGINNIMLIVVRERRQEIGVRRAIGAKPSSIMGQIIAESCLMTVIAGMAGMMLAILATMLLDRFLLPVFMSDSRTMFYMEHQLSFQLAPEMALLCMLLIVATSVAVGMIPARKALSISAIDALREE